MASNEKNEHGESPQAMWDIDSMLEGCRTGDRDAQRALYERFREMVFRIVVRTIGHAHAEDVTQQVFLQVCRRIDQFAGRSSFETWLYRLATNEALQHLRKEKRWKFQPLDVEPMRAQTCDNRLDEKELLEQALDRLPAELRLVFVLRELEGKSYQEISQISDIPEGTVGSRLNKARRELQQHLTDLGWNR